MNEVTRRSLSTKCGNQLWTRVVYYGISAAYVGSNRSRIDQYGTVSLIPLSRKHLLYGVHSNGSARKIALNWLL